MNILILGSGRVGSSLAEHLVKEEGNHITVVDPDAQILEQLQNRLDINTVNGHVSLPSILKEANCEKADLIIAVSGVDDTNILACKIAHRIAPNAKTVCRIRSQDHIDHSDLTAEGLDGSTIINTFINPQKLVTDYIMRLIETPGALQSVNFVDKKLRLVVVKARADGLLVNRKIKEISKHLPAGIDARFVAIFRNNQSIPTDGDSIIEAGDEVSVIAERKNIHCIMEELRRDQQQSRKITIAGGGQVGVQLAQALEHRYCKVKLIDHNAKNSESISNRLGNTLVLLGNAADPKLLAEERIEDSDIFIAVTNSDESNIISSMMAKSINCKKVMALVNQPAYVSLLEQSQIDIAISPDQITVSSILSLVRAGNTEVAFPLRKGAAEAIQIVLSPHSPAIGKRLDEIAAPTGLNVGALVRNEDCLIAHRDVVFAAGDHVVMFVANKKLIKDVHRLFGS